MGLLGWLARRALAAWIFPPLLAFWYGLFAFVVRLPAGVLGMKERPQAELVIAALLMAFISDFLIVRAVKRAMKAREAENRGR